MNIKSAEFAKGIIGTDDILYDGKFQVAFLGKSNVGKSTLINSLTKRNNLARSSSNPGKTIRMDFFLINNGFYFVDFPGYGYARRSKEKREKLAKMILWYLLYSEVKNRLVILIIDAKIGMTAFDRDMLKILREEHIDHIIVANKADKFKMGEKEKKLANIRSLYNYSEIIPYSSKQKYNHEELSKKIFSYLYPPTR
jgi:GTP-binding protein